MGSPSSPEEPLPCCLLLGAAVLVAVAMEAFLHRKLNACAQTLSNTRQACSCALPGATRPPVVHLGCAPMVAQPGIDMDGPGDALLLESKQRHSTMQERQKLRRLGKLHSPISGVVVAGTSHESVFAAQGASPSSIFGLSCSVTRYPTFSRPPSYDDARPGDVDEIDSFESQTAEYRPDQYARLDRFDRI